MSVVKSKLDDGGFSKQTLALTHGPLPRRVAKQGKTKFVQMGVIWGNTVLAPATRLVPHNAIRSTGRKFLLPVCSSPQNRGACLGTQIL